MAKFECHNCGNKFEKFCDDVSDSTDAKCPSCLSHWTNIIFKVEKITFPKPPYIDPPYPKPYINPFPQDPIVPWPYPTWRITCEKGTSDGTYPNKYEVNYN